MIQTDTNKSEAFALKGTICDCGPDRRLRFHENSYVVSDGGICRGVYDTLPDAYAGIAVRDCGSDLIIPGFTDLHLHAPQYTYCGTGMDLELLEWLSTYTFPEEAHYRDLDYAGKAYRIFVRDLKMSATTSAVIFATIHKESTLLLMDLLEKSGMRAYVGKVNMDRNGSPEYQEASASASARDTEDWILECNKRNYRTVRPILTPRFTPSCSDELMEMLGNLRRKYGLPVQSHLSENKAEIQWVKELCPDTANYGETYDRFGLFGGDIPQDHTEASGSRSGGMSDPEDRSEASGIKSGGMFDPAGGTCVMAHCVFSPDQEVDLMKRRGVFIAHCPESNMNVSTGIAPVRRYLDQGLHIGLGSDTAGSSHLEISYAMAEAIRASKVRHQLVDQTLAPLTLEDAFYMATRGGGAFFGKVGAFDKGYQFDAVILDDSRLETPRKQSLENRLERLIYLGDDREIKAKYVGGRLVF